MRIQTTAQQTQATGTDYDPQRPYRDYSAVELAEYMEIQHNRGQGFDPAAVFELVVRACELESIKGGSATQ